MAHCSPSPSDDGKAKQLKKLRRTVENKNSLFAYCVQNASKRAEQITTGVSLGVY